VAATSQSRVSVSFADVAGLEKLVGTRPANPTGFGGLLYYAVNEPEVDLAVESNAIDVGTSLKAAQYGIVAGTGQNQIGLLAGGQSAARISAALTAQGWRRDGSRLLAPTLAEGTPGSPAWVKARVAQSLAQVRADGGDLSYGQPRGVAGPDRQPLGHDARGRPPDRRAGPVPG